MNNFGFSVGWSFILVPFVISVNKYSPSSSNLVIVNRCHGTDLDFSVTMGDMTDQRFRLLSVKSILILPFFFLQFSTFALHFYPGLLWSNFCISIGPLSICVFICILYPLNECKDPKYGDISS